MKCTINDSIKTSFRPYYHFIDYSYIRKSDFVLDFPKRPRSFKQVFFRSHRTCIAAYQKNIAKFRNARFKSNDYYIRAFFYQTFIKLPIVQSCADILLIPSRLKPSAKPPSTNMIICRNNLLL